MKDKLSKLNTFDGLVHNQDGSKEFLEGGHVKTVTGANLSSLAQSTSKGKPKSKAEEQEDKDAEDEEKNADANDAKEKGKKIEEAKKAAEEKEACIKEKLSKLNPLDGLVHNADGSLEFLEGGRVGGANGA